MALAELPTAIPIDRWASRWPSAVTEPAIVPLSGEHDLSTRRALAELLARAISDTDGSIVVDLRLVSFMDASTLGLLAGAGGFLGARDRTLVLRAPSPFARRVIEVGGLGPFLETQPAVVTRQAS
jgi:anti-anti-sigma factor